MNKIVEIAKKIQSKFVLVVSIFLLLIAGNVLVAKVIEVNEARKGNVDQDQMMEGEEHIQDPMEKSMDEGEVESLDYTIINPSKEQAEVEKLGDEAIVINPLFYISVDGGETALEALEKLIDVEYDEYDFGVYVKSIGGIEGNDEYFWALYVNDEQSQTGADQTILEAGDKMEWRYEKITF